MKNMHNFYRELFEQEARSPDRQRLREMTGFSRAQLAKVSNQTTWFLWHNDKPNESKKSPDEK